MGKVQPEQFIEVVELFGKELTEKRGVRISSFVLDDGWDDPQLGFELPQGAARKYSLKSPWKEDGRSEAIVLTAGREQTFRIESFDVLLFDATPL